MQSSPHALANAYKVEKKINFETLWLFEIMRRSEEDKKPTLWINLFFKKNFYFHLDLYFSVLKLNLLHHILEYNLKFIK